MKFGVTFPQTEIGPDPIAVRDFAQAAESARFDYLAAFDHVLGAHPDRFVGHDLGFPAPPYLYHNQFREPFTLFAYLAGLTKRIELTTSVVILPQRQTALVAKQAAEVDLLSSGRLRLGVGIGWNHTEYEALNEDFHTRGAREEEQITVLRKLWTEDLVTFRGRWHTLDRVGINPRPQRLIPIWMGGGFADRIVQRVSGVSPWRSPGQRPAHRTARFCAASNNFPKTAASAVRSSRSAPVPSRTPLYLALIEPKIGITHCSKPKPLISSTLAWFDAPAARDFHPSLCRSRRAAWGDHRSYLQN